MTHQFRTHYTLDQARALLPKIRQWLDAISRERQRLDEIDPQIESLLASGADAGGHAVNRKARGMAAIKGFLNEFESRGILIKDLDRGLIDFPAILGGREVFLCWERDEEDIEFWHDLDTGYAGRERIGGGDQ